MTIRSKSSMYGLNIGDEVEFIGLPKTIRGITNPLIGKTGIVANIAYSRTSSRRRDR